MLLFIKSIYIENLTFGQEVLNIINPILYLFASLLTQAALLMLVLLPSRPMSPFCWPKDNCLSRLCSLRIGSMLPHTMPLIGMNPLFGSPLDYWLQSHHPIGGWSWHPWYWEIIICSDKHNITLSPKNINKQQGKSSKKKKKTCLAVNNIKWTRTGHPKSIPNP